MIWQGQPGSLQDPLQPPVGSHSCLGTVGPVADGEVATDNTCELEKAALRITLGVGRSCSRYRLQKLSKARQCALQGVGWGGTSLAATATERAGSSFQMNISTPRLGESLPMASLRLFPLACQPQKHSPSHTWVMDGLGPWQPAEQVAGHTVMPGCQFFSQQISPEPRSVIQEPYHDSHILMDCCFLFGIPGALYLSFLTVNRE